MTHFAESQLCPYPAASLEGASVWGSIDPDEAYDILDQAGDKTPDQIREELGILPEVVTLTAVSGMSETRLSKATVLAALRRTARAAA